MPQMLKTRRFLSWLCTLLGLTWKDHGPLEGELVDHLIEQVDNNQADLMPAWIKKVHSPFAAFSVVQASPTISLRSPETPETSMERFLFHHYTTHVAKIMMPYDHPFNPWIQQYPAAALVCRGSTDHALYDALLAHAAYNLSELYGKDGKMLYQATRYYEKAIQKILARIGGKSSGFATTFASILTLVLVEVYSGNASKWRQHLHGANTLVRQLEAIWRDLSPSKHRCRVCI
ncbi:hypothetical protein M409DRAFT_18104 [Zasmidium cellare ATCC 36951]|uniref:Transcription factor domain-containing protein n=1 Tax=Zasmidium cellare ATCC 36951 TaxID=1080233 RepID=A0A6A6D140_ZASCE|nr:uncharacterized protein M409DRAFT_18104 [Zasmidium cellare ATCC 36951]KAF2171872.1 hypothetical protein M409DRAFT_18104 [Zasmidium cellare ATCC 36951]